MTLFEDNTRVFIVRIWLERRDIESATVEWRGVIEHIGPDNDKIDNEKHYFNSLDDIATFIAPCLEVMGVELGLFWRAKQWLKQQKQSLKKLT